MQDCCFRLQLAGKRKSTQLMCLTAVLFLLIVNSALYSRSLGQAEQLERLKREIINENVKDSKKPPAIANRAGELQNNLQASSPSSFGPPKLPHPAPQQAIAPVSPDMIALDRALIDALANMATACASSTICIPLCEIPAAPTQRRIDAANRFQSAAAAYQHGLANGGRHPSPASPLPVPRFAGQAGNVKCYSQTDEDGILLYIFAKIGAKSRRAVEICSGDGYENNVANLAVLHGWDVIMMDGRENNMAHARRFYTQPGMPPTMKMPHLIRDFITRANVNQLISSKGFSGEIDLFSLDMDGVDWWIWHALEVVKPRVVIAEIQELWLWTDSKTRPYKADFSASGIAQMGASIAAFNVLAKFRGYRLIGCVTAGFNAIFLRNDIAPDAFPTYDPKGCFSQVHGEYEEELKRRRVDAEKIEWVDVDEQLMQKLQGPQAVQFS